MQIPNHSSSGEVDFNMTPMIDVVFLLIIFFLVSSHLARQEAQMELELPEADSISEARDDAAPRVTLNVTLAGDLVLAGRRVTPEQLEPRLRERLQADGQDLEVRIRSDRGVAYRAVEPILSACARSGIWNVKFAVYERE